MTTLPLEEWMSAIIDYRGKTPQKTTSGVPLITAKVVKGGRIETPDEFIAAAEYDEWMRRGLPQVGDVVITTEAPLGEVAQLSESRIALAQRLILLRGKPGLLDNTYLKYLLMSDEMQGQLVSRASGTTVIGIKQSELRKVTLSLPAIDEQEAIASVLGSLDDKIEQNRRTAAKLEALARATFHAWFVDFAPVHAKAAGRSTYPGLPPAAFAALPTTFTDSPLGSIPRGWTAGAMGDVGKQRREAVSGDDLIRDDAYIGLEHMPRRSIMLNEWESAAKVTSNKSRFRKGDILFGKLRPYFHKVGRAPVDGVCSTDIVVVYPKHPRWSAWLLMLLFSDGFVGHTDRTSAGTKMPRTNWQDMAAYGVAVPPDHVVDHFEGTVGPMLAWIQSAIHECRHLAAVRDYLLPRLLSGAVRVQNVPNAGGEQ